MTALLTGEGIMKKILFLSLLCVLVGVFSARAEKTITTTTATTTITTVPDVFPTPVSQVIVNAPAQVTVYEDNSELYHRQNIRPAYYNYDIAPALAIGGGVLLYDYGYHRGYRHGRRHHR